MRCRDCALHGSVSHTLLHQQGTACCRPATPLRPVAPTMALACGPVMHSACYYWQMHMPFVHHNNRLSYTMMVQPIKPPHGPTLVADIIGLSMHVEDGCGPNQKFCGVRTYMPCTLPSFIPPQQCRVQNLDGNVTSLVMSGSPMNERGTLTFGCKFSIRWMDSVNYDPPITWARSCACSLSVVTYDDFWTADCGGCVGPLTTTWDPFQGFIDNGFAAVTDKVHYLGP